MTKRHDTSADVHGWRFRCRSAPAMSSAERDELTRALHLRPPTESLPEMLFAANGLSLRHASGFSMRFDALTALRMWSQTRGDLDHELEFTFGSSYLGSVAAETSALQHGERHYADVAGEPTTETLPLEKLRQQVQILYYDRVILFEDDVRDLGEICLEAKVRVMEFGFLVLLRYYCRVDGKFVKLVDTRYYHEFGASFVWRDCEVREATIPELQRILNPLAHSETQSHDFSADAVYQALRPASTATEKIPIPIGMARALLLALLASVAARVGADASECFGVEVGVEWPISCGQVFGACEGGVRSLNRHLELAPEQRFRCARIVSASEFTTVDSSGSTLFREYSMVAHLAPIVQCYRPRLTIYSMRFLEDFRHEPIPFSDGSGHYLSGQVSYSIKSCERQPLTESERVKLAEQYTHEHFALLARLNDTSVWPFNALEPIAPFD